MSDGLQGEGTATSWAADDVVKFASTNVNRFSKSYLRQSVCELRFPTLMELGGPRPPEKFVTALRKDYPYLEQQNEVRLSVGSTESGVNNTHIFRSSKANWSVSLKESSIALETTGYTNFEQFKVRINKLVDAASLIIDSDFFTRVGLRYINLIDGIDDPANDWINPALVGPLKSQSFIGVADYAGRLTLGAVDGGCLFQHGLKIGASKKGASPELEYMIDIDVYRSDVSLPVVSEVIDRMHSQAFNLFDWSLGEKARAYLSGE